MPLLSDARKPLANPLPAGRFRPARAGRFLSTAFLAAALLLGGATLVLAAPDADQNPPGPRGGPGTDWENPPGPRGGPGASPDPLRWDPARLRHYLADHPRLDPDLPWLRRDDDGNPPGPRGGRGTNWENPPGPRGGPGVSPDPVPWPLARLRNWLADHPRLNAPDPARPHRPERRLEPVRPGLLAAPAPVFHPLPAYRAPVYRAAPAGRRR